MHRSYMEKRRSLKNTKIWRRVGDEIWIIEENRGERRKKGEREAVLQVLGFSQYFFFSLIIWTVKMKSFPSNDSNKIEA